MAMTRIDFWAWISSTRQYGLGKEVTCWFQCWKNQLGLFDWSNKTGGTTDMKIGGSVLEEK